MPNEVKDQVHQQRYNLRLHLQKGHKCHWPKPIHNPILWKNNILHIQKHMHMPF